MVVATLCPLTFLKLSTCTAQTKETRMLTAVSHIPEVMKAGKNRRSASKKTTICLQCSRSYSLNLARIHSVNRMPGKRDDGEEVKGDFLDIAFRKVEPEEHDIPCLRIGKDMPSRDVGVDIKESSRHRQQGAEQERFRYLNVFAVFHPLIQPERRLSLGKSPDAPAGSFSPVGGRLAVFLFACVPQPFAESIWNATG